MDSQVQDIPWCSSRIAITLVHHNTLSYHIRFHRNCQYLIACPFGFQYRLRTFFYHHNITFAMAEIAT
jgi:hypothetical protein